MKSTVDKLQGLNRKINIEVPAETVQQTFTQIYKGIQKNANIKGFRKGKAPMTTIKELYSQNVRQDVIERLISENFHAALQEHSLQPIGQPMMNFESLDEDKDFNFTVEFEVRPEVKINQFENLKVQKEKIDISDERIDTVLDNLRKHHGDTKPVLEVRPAQQGDISVIDFAGTINGEPLEGGQAEDFDLELGSNSFIPGFEEGIVGMNVGDSRDLQLAFPTEYHNKDIAGQPVHFKVTLKALKAKTEAELNDEFAKRIGQMDTLDELKDAIRKDLESTEVSRIEEEFKNRLLSALVAANPIEVPEKLKEQQKAKLIEDVKQKMTQQGMNEQELKEYVEKWNDDFDKTAAEMIQSSFLIDTLADQLNLRATPKDIEDKITEYAAQTGIDVERVQEFYNEKDRKSSLAYNITEQNVVKHLIDKADVSEVSADKLQA